MPSFTCSWKAATALGTLAVLALTARSGAGVVLLSDDFNRADSTTVGNDWAETESGSGEARIAANRLRIDSGDDRQSPIIEHSFTETTTGILTWSFTFDWVRSGDEQWYELWMQLGDGDSMVAPGTSDSTGVAVNLKWAGPNHGLDNHEGLGYVSAAGATTTELTTVTGEHTIEIVVNLQAGTYDVIVDATTVGDDLPFDHDVPINTVRFYTDELNQVNVSSREFDDLEIELSGVYSDVSSATGFDVSTTSAQTYGSGLNWADLDADGDLDAILTGSSAKLMLSNSEGASFFASNFFGSIRRQGALVDLDNDGDIDFWAGNDNSYYAQTLLENDGSASFTDSGDLGFSDPSNNEGVAAADVNGDGWCDIVMFSANGNWIGHHGGSTPVALTATNASGYGLNDSGDDGNGDYCSSGDVNNDGFLDFFYHYNGGKLFLSDGDGTYTENASGITVTTGDNDKFGSAWGDYDNDGDLDLFVPRYDSGSTGSLWRNDSGSFTNVTASAGIDDTSSQRSCAWGDYDNDGDLDLYIVTSSGDNVLYANNGDGTFTADSSEAPASGNAHDAVFVDYDNDGDLDLAVTRENASAMLYQNALNDTNYLKVRVIGNGNGGTNVAGIGTRIDLYDSSGATLLARRDIGVARGFGGTEPLWAHFGGVDATQTYLVRVHFRSGSVDTLVVPENTSTTIGATTIDQMLTITESAADNLRLIRWMETDPIDD